MGIINDDEFRPVLVSLSRWDFLCQITRFNGVELRFNMATGLEL